MTEFTKRYDVDYDALACCSMFMLLPMKVNLWCYEDDNDYGDEDDDDDGW